MKYREKEVAHLTDVELVEAAFALNEMQVKSDNAKNDPRYAKKFKNQPPKQLNPDFLALKAEVYSEIDRRGL